MYSCVRPKRVYAVNTPIFNHVKLSLPAEYFSGVDSGVVLTANIEQYDSGWLYGEEAGLRVGIPLHKLTYIMAMFECYG